MKTTKANILLRTEEMNCQPTRADMMKLLDPLHKHIRYIDTDRDCWTNRPDTLVFELDCEDIARFGGRGVTDAIEQISDLIIASRPDEADRIRRGTKLIWRLWWD